MAKQQSSTQSYKAREREEHIPESEQWGIIQNSGLLDSYDGPRARVLKRNTSSGRFQEVDPYDIETDNEEEEDSEEEREEGGPQEPPTDLPDKIFDAVLLVIPLTFLWLMMDILVQQQYNIEPTIMDEVRRVGRAVPAIIIMVGFTAHRKAERWLQALMFWASIAVGMRLVYVVNKSPRLTVIRQGPPLTVLWVYMIIQLHLPSAIISLMLVAAGIKYLGLKIRL
ncbi:uncharacterized protein EI90DRAFT_3117024 [Cantharellus anzutake]|uniref:uncharacterized protein n=1 Tax=Cantharellus anzutake TaxID=1750568 RepID=UPI0019035FDA|nr:uncharacterized protein EI90DRAFT_3117024 [Cantharellus anzutake]KAF8340489.1 hypothetical protein EI90DRAFT_3117024 [Cantharellus anzutake]